MTHSTPSASLFYYHFGSGILLAIGLWLVSFYDYLLFHSLVEILSIVIAFSFFITVWNSRAFLKHQYLIIVGMSYFFIGFQDTLHMLAYEGMGLFPEYDANLPTQLWISARYMESLAFLFAPLFFTRTVRIPAVAGLYILATTLILASLFYYPIFPTCYVEGQGLTPFKIISEYLICGILTAAAFLLHLHRRHFETPVYRMILASIFLTIASELSLTFYLSLYSAPNMLGHLLKILSYYLIYKAFIHTGIQAPLSAVVQELHEREEELRVSKDRYELAMYFANAGMWEWNLIDNTVYYSPGWKKLLGYEDHEIPNQFSEWERLTQEEDAKAVLDIWNRLIENPDKRFEKKFRMRHKNGHWIHILCRADVVLDDAGNAVRAVGTHVDITRWKQAEDELQASRLKFLSVFNLQPDAIFILDTSIPPVVLDCNLAASKIFGYEREEMTGRDVVHLHISNEEQQRFRSLLYAGIETSPRFQINDYHMRRKNGQIFPVEINILELKDGDGNQTGFVSVIRDMTQQRQMEARLRQAQKMESIGNLAGGIAHDFNNILYPIVGMSELLMEDLSPDSVEYKNAREILKAGKRGADLVKQILAFSRQSKQQVMPVRVQKIAKEVLQLTRSTIPVSIEIKADIQKDCGMVAGDASQIHQILMNLFTNAYHAIEDTGTIRLVIREMYLEESHLKEDRPIVGILPDTASLLQSRHHPEPQAGNEKEHEDAPSLNRAPNTVEIRVSDTGCGIPPHILPRIFDPYFTTKETGKGTGLGLAVVHGIIKEYHGDIQVSSTVGIGTEFIIHLPLPDREKEDRITPEPAAPVAGSEHILLVDDEGPVLDLLRQMLERLGYTVSARACGVDALGLLRANPDRFDLVISDMTMPHMTGDRLAEEIRRVRPDIPIILSTGFSERLHRDRLTMIGVSEILMKPVSRREMAEAVRRALDVKTEARQHLGGINS